MTARTTWILAIVGLLGVNVVAMVILAVVANRGGAQVIPDYYAKAAHYDDELARSAASRALGWHVDVAVEDGAIHADVFDATGKPIEGAQVRITGFQRAHASDLLDVELSMLGRGRYLGAIHPRRGWYDLVASVQARGAHYTQRVAIESQ